jgi:hypothetical protein
VPLSFICGVIAAKAVELPALRVRDRLFPDERREVPLSSVKPSPAIT